VGYDDSVHPLTDVANLFSDQYSISITRILPHLTQALEKENEIREEQGVPPLKELSIVSYSQGSVLILDLVLRLTSFKREYEALRKAAGKEWKLFESDPELQLFREAAEDFRFIKNIRVQRQKEFDRDYDFKQFYDRLLSRFAKAFERFRTYFKIQKMFF